MSAYANVPFPVMFHLAAIATKGDPLQTYTLVNVWMQSQLRAANQQSWVALGNNYGEPRARLG